MSIYLGWAQCASGHAVKVGGGGGLLDFWVQGFRGDGLKKRPEVRIGQNGAACFSNTKSATSVYVPEFVSLTMSNKMSIL